MPRLLRALLVVPALCLLLAIPACQHRSASTNAWSRWRQRRTEDIGGASGWAALAGLHWLTEGDHVVGSSPESDVRLPEGAAPARVGVLRHQRGAVEFIPEPGVQVRLRGKPAGRTTLSTDASDHPDRLEAGRITFWILERGERRGVRVRDPQGPGRRSFHGIDVFPYDPRWRINARFEPYEPHRVLEVTDITGNVSRESVPGVLVFTLDGRECRLEPVIDREAGDLFINFKDASSAHGTYPGGRFLHVPRPTDVAQPVTVDFNLAYNPPCAFTPYATCPVPPRSNTLPVSIHAGERFSGH